MLKPLHYHCSCLSSCRLSFAILHQLSVVLFTYIHYLLRGRKKDLCRGYTCFRFLKNIVIIIHMMKKAVSKWTESLLFCYYFFCFVSEFCYIPFSMNSLECVFHLHTHYMGAEIMEDSTLQDEKTHTQHYLFIFIMFF